MKKRGLAAAALLLVLVSIGVASGTGRDSQQPQAAAAAEQAYGKLPLSFEPNRGQAERRTAFVARGAGYGISLRATEALFSLGKRDRLSMELVGANAQAALVPERRLPGRVNYLLGNDRSKWLTGIPTYGRLLARDVYPGIDLAYYGRQGSFEYDLLVHPGASPDEISLRFAGARKITLEPNGDLSLKLPGGTLRQLAPRVYQQIEGKRRIVDGRFSLRVGRVGFTLGAYDRSRTLVIDPTLVYSTYLGGSGDDYGRGIAVDSAGAAYVSGYTYSTNFPTASPSQGTNAGSIDAFVTKLSETTTGVALRSFAASRRGGLIVLRWRTGSELSLLGYHVYRERSGTLVKLNRTLIPSARGGASGHTYSWLDRGAPRSGSIKYRLQAVSASGKRSWVGAVAVGR